MNFEVPRTLPVDHLSHSSVQMYLRCPEKWRRRYIEAEYEPTGPAALIGKSVGNGISAGYVEKMAENSDFGQVMLDTVSDVVDQVARDEDVAWQDSSPAEVKDSAIKCVGVYYDRVALQFEPETVEEGFEIKYPETDWNVTGFIDLTGVAPGLAADIHDVKTVGKADNSIDVNPQATLYIASRYVRDGSLPGFAWHQIRRPLKTKPAEVRLMTTERTVVQVDNYLARIAQVAREIEWRVETGNWQGAVPGEWWCSEKFCGYFPTCPYGGQR